MKKKILGTLLLIFMFMPSFVFAAEVENTCEYETQLNGDIVNVTCDFYSDNSKPKCIFYTLEEDGNQETLANWGKVYNGDGNGVAGTWYKQNKKCIPYIVYVEKDSLINGFELAGFGTLAEANAYSIEQSKWYTTVVVPPIKSNDTIEDEINGYIEMLNDIGKSFQLDDYCELKDGKYNVSLSGYEQDLCTKAIQGLYDKINEWDKNIRDWIGEAKLSQEDEIVKKYIEARNKARAQIYYLWDEELIENPSDDPIDGGSGGGREPEYDSSSQTCVSCGDGALTNIPEQLPMFIRNLIWLIQMITPIILIGLGMYDFIKAVIAGDEKVMKESQNRFIKRIIAAVLIFMVIAIVKFVFGLIPGETTLSCIPCFTTDSSNCSEPYICNTKDFDIEMDGRDDGESSDGATGGSSQTKTCGDRGNLTECNKDGNCSWNYSGNFCEVKKSQSGGNKTQSCGDKGTLSECNKDGNCTWNYSGNYCELKKSVACGDRGSLTECNKDGKCKWSYNGSYCEEA